MTIQFPRFAQALDPDGRLDFMWKFELNTGESIDEADVEVVDATSSAPLSPSPLTIHSVSPGLIAGNLWGVTAWISGAGATPGDYYLRCRIATDSSPFPREDDYTMRLVVAQK